MNGWSAFFREVKAKDYAGTLKAFLDREYATFQVFPRRSEMFKAFELTPPESVKVVIIGQDPYHQPGQAMGLCFSVRSGVPLPPSLMNIYKEIEGDLGVKMNYEDGDLSYLARQGVFLLNAYLTVRRSAPLSHHTKEYDLFMTDVISYLNALEQPIVFLLWGSIAKRVLPLLTNPDHLVLRSVHPSPLAASHGGWFGNHHFSKANGYLTAHGLAPIDWKN